MTDRFLDLAEQNVRWLKDEPRAHHEMLENARIAVEEDPVTLARQAETWKANNRLWRAIMLSPTLDVCVALCAGQHVPSSRLDPEWLARFGIRNQEAA